MHIIIFPIQSYSIPQNNTEEILLASFGFRLDVLFHQ